MGRVQDDRYILKIKQYMISFLIELEQLHGFGVYYCKQDAASVALTPGLSTTRLLLLKDIEVHVICILSLLIDM